MCTLRMYSLDSDVCPILLYYILYVGSKKNSYICLCLYSNGIYGHGIFFFVYMVMVYLFLFI